MTTSMSKSVIVSGDICKINQRDWNLIIESENQTSVFKPRSDNLSRVIINGFKGYISLQSLRWMSIHKTDIAILDVFGNLQTSIIPRTSENGSLLLKQADIYKNNNLRMKFAKMLIDHKITSQINFVRNLSNYYSIDFDKYLTTIDFEKHQKITRFPDLLGREGRTTGIYWKTLSEVFKHYGIEWKGRDGRDKNNRNADNFINASLNYLYALLQQTVRVSLLSNGFSIKIGILHDTYKSQEPLVFDLMESLRYIADLSLIELISRKEITKSDFTFFNDFRLLIKSEARNKLVNRFNYNLSRKIKLENQSFQVINAIDRYVQLFKQSLLTGRKWNPLPNLDMERNDSTSIRNKILSMSSIERKVKGINKSTLWYQQQALRAGKARKLYSPSIRKLEE